MVVFCSLPIILSMYREKSILWMKEIRFSRSAFARGRVSPFGFITLIVPGSYPE